MDLYSGWIGVFWIISNFIFMAVMGSSGNKMSLESIVEIASSEADTVISTSISAPMTGYVTSVRWEITSVTAWSHDCVLRSGYWHKPEADELFNNNAGVMEVNATGIQHLHGHYILHTLPIPATAGNNVAWSYTKKTYLEIEKNDFSTVRFRLDDLGNTLTTGDITIKTFVKFLVGCLNHNGRKRAVPVFNHIFGLTTDTDWTSAFLPYCNGIIRNVRLSGLNYGSGDADEGETVLRFGPDVTLEDNAIGSGDGVEIRSDDRVLITVLGASSGTFDSTIFTNFRIGHWKVDRTAQVGIMVAQGTESDNIAVIIDFDFFPDYGAQIEWSFHVQNLSVAGGWDQFLPSPFEMYVRTIEVNWAVSGTAAILNKIRVGLYDSSRPDIGLSSEVEVHGGSLAGSIDTMIAFTNELPANVVGSFDIDLETINDVLVNANTGDDEFDVYDFIHQGGLFAFACQNIVGADAPDFDVIVRAESRHSGKIDFGGSDFDGQLVYNQETTK